MSRTTPMLPICLLFAWGLAGCDSGAPDAGSVEAAAPPAGGFAGTWDVKGTTQDLSRGDTRSITGIIVLSEKGGVYTGQSELATQFPTEGGPVHADVLGTATGERKGNMLSGSAETQLVIQTVPGVNPGFAFIPRSVGPRIQSKFSAHFRRDGTLVVQLENEAAAGERYSPTRTMLYGRRAEKVGAGDGS